MCQNVVINLLNFEALALKNPFKALALNNSKKARGFKLKIFKSFVTHF
jgi:hypothetical protein